MVPFFKMMPLGPDPNGIIFEFDGRGEHLGVIQKLAADGKCDNAVCLSAVGAITENVQIVREHLGKQRPLGITAARDRCFPPPA